MACGGGANLGANNRGNHVNTGNANNDNGGNQFANLDVSDQSHVEDSNSPFYLGNGDHPSLNLVTNKLCW